MKIQSRFPLVAALALATFLACEDDDPTGPESARNFAVTMTGAKEIPVKSPAGTGSATFTLDAAETTLSYSISVQNMTSNITASHIHLGDATTPNGSVIVALTTPVNGQTVTGTITSTTPLNLGLSWQALLALIRNGLTYVNVHTANNGGGEIRGQIDSTP